MKTLLSILFFVLGLFGAFAQISNVSEEFLLPSSLIESSGAIYYNNKLITHNDSGGENKLYEIDIDTEQITRTVTITNAINTDWEDITQDDTSIYIGDIGNNNGNRMDLKIYKINKTDYTGSTSVTAEIISYSYSDQTDFTSNPDNTIWDAEALISFDANNLMLFTKNWVDEEGFTKAYLIPKTQGTHEVSPQPTTLTSNGLISGGTFNSATGKLYLIGYSKFGQPFVWDCINFSLTDVFSGTNTQTQLSSLGLEQAEAITFVDENNYLVTSESFSRSAGSITLSDDAKLISFSTNDQVLSNVSIEKVNDVVLYPNPVSNILNIKSDVVSAVEIFDIQLKQLYQGHENTIDMSRFNPGVYLVKMHSNNNTFVIKKLVKQ